MIKQSIVRRQPVGLNPHHDSSSWRLGKSVRGGTEKRTNWVHFLYSKVATIVEFSLILAILRIMLLLGLRWRWLFL